MLNEDQQYWVNTPLFLKYKSRFDFKRFQSVRKLKSVVLNERIVEIPFAIDTLSQLSGRGKVLDFGCSESILPLHLASLGYDVTGIDIREYPYVAPNFRFVQNDVLDPSFSAFKEAEFDALLCVSVLEHIGLGCYGKNDESVSDIVMLEKLRTFLKPRGLLVLTVPFGVNQTTEWQRFYDTIRLQKLLSGFNVKTIKYFCSEKNESQRCNFWKEITKDEAGRIESTGSVTCVACVSANLA